MLKHAFKTCVALLIMNSAMAADYTINKHVANNPYEQTASIDGQYWSDPFWNGTIPTPRVSVTSNITITTTDNTFDFAATYDNDYLYLAVNVNETYVYNQSLGWFYEDSNVNTPWEDDAVEIFIDPKNGQPIFQAIINPRGFNTPATIWTNANYSSTGILYAAAFYTGTKEVHQYIVEVAIPWSKFGITPSSGLQLGFDIAVDDDDNGGARDGQIAWKGTSSNWSSSANYGNVKLNAADYGAPYVYYPTGAPVIDGEVQHDAAYVNSPVLNVTKQVIGTSDNEVNYRLTWDGSYLYVGIVVWDNHAYTNTLYNDSPEIWNDDAVEIFIDPLNTKLTSFNPSLHRQILVQHTPYGTSPEVSVNGNSTGILYATKILYSPIYTGGYTVEVAIPWSNLGINPNAGTYIGFDISVDDDDDGGNRDSQLAWKGTANNWQDASAWGTILLTYNGFANAKAGALATNKNAGNSVATSCYPNPVTDQLNLQFGNPSKQLKLMNSQGQVLRVENVEGMSNYTIPATELSSGLYIITITNENDNIETFKVVK